jgi:hypothetical protein
MKKIYIEGLVLVYPSRGIRPQARNLMRIPVQAEIKVNASGRTWRLISDGPDDALKVARYSDGIEFWRANMCLTRRLMH